MFVGRKDLDEVQSEMEKIEKLEKSIGLIEHKIAKTFKSHHKYSDPEEAVKEAVKKHHYHLRNIEKVCYAMKDTIMYVYVKLNSSINPLTKATMSEDIKDNLGETDIKMSQAIVHFYLDDNEATNSNIFTWNEIEIQ